ncbi:MAG: transporter substrate-binding domain-containing protein, partial [Campylobacterota bacterium]|nr:transporter substrate-binding domain-containing protein [Campylobacterota bacterium]
MKLINILFFLFFSLSLNATVEKKLNLAQSIAALVANPVYQVDTEQVEITIRSIVQDNITIKAIKIKDADDGEIIVEFFRQKDKLVFGKNIPNSILEGKSLVSDIIFEDENIGDIVVYFNDVNDIGLTLKEKQWIETHTVKIGVEQWSPVVFSNDGKDIDGITGDFTKKIIELTGLKVEIVNDNWDILLKDFKDKKLDLLPATYHTDKRTKFGLYSDPYFKMKNAIYLKDSNTKITSLKDLEGDTVAIPKGYGTIDKIEKEFPKIKIVLTKDLDDSINRVLNGSVTAFYEGQIATQVKIKSELIEGLKSIPVTEFKSPTLHYFSKIDEPILQSIIQKALNSLDYTTRNMITSKWVTQHNTLNITDDEQKWLDKEETINYVYDPDWAPFEWTNEVGEHVGIIADILHIVSNSSGVKFQAVPTVKWSDAVAKMENNEVDMYSAVVQNERREKYAKFSSKNIYSSPAVIVTKVDDDTVYLDIQSALKTKNVGLAKGYAIGDYVKKTYPDLKFTTVESIVDGFEKLEHGDIDVFVLNAATAQYFIKQKGYDDIRIATKIDFSFDLKIAIQKNMPQEVLSILDKAINNISQKELNDIYYKWTNVQAKVKTDWVLVGQIASVVFIIILFILWNNRKLKLMVESKTSEIRMLLKAFDKNVIASKTDKNGIITYASEAFCEISGYTQEELIGQPHSLMRDPDMPKEIFEDLWKTIKEEKVWRGEVKNRKKDGGYYWVDVIITPECHDADKICGYSAIRQDITSKKEV